MNSTKHFVMSIYIPLVPLPELPGALAALGYQSCSYHKCWEACVGEKIPAQKVGRTWVIQQENLHHIARVLGLRRKEPANA